MSRNCIRSYSRESGHDMQGNLLHRSPSDDLLVVLYIVPYVQI
jgi:hypothetical protein